MSVPTHVPGTWATRPGGAGQLIKSTEATRPTHQSDLQHFSFFVAAHLFHPTDFIVGEFLYFLEGALLLVLGNFLIFGRLLDEVVAVATDIAHRGAMVFERLVEVLH